MPFSVLTARENGCGGPQGWLKTLIVRSTNPAVSVITMRQDHIQPQLALINYTHYYNAEMHNYITYHTQAQQCQEWLLWLEAQ